MSKPQPYQHWTRDQMFDHLRSQAEMYGYDNDEIETIKAMVFHDEWNPMLEFDGCTAVSDVLHPFLPCFKHDFNWRVFGGGKWADVEFKSDLIRCGVKPFKAWRWYTGVRVAWNLYFKWKKKKESYA